MSLPPPPPPPLPGRDRRRDVVIAGAAIVGWIVTVALYAVASSNAHSYREQRRVEGIDVVERGWTVDGGRVSFGAIVENTTDESLEPFAIYATAYDADDHPIDGLTEMVLPAGALGPGEQVGLADTVYGADPPEIARLAFDSDEVGGKPVGAVTVSDIELTRGRLSTTVNFTMEASFDETARMEAYIVIRDARGAVVAGNRGRVVVGGRDRETALDILTDVVPEGATAEVYVVAA